MSLAISRVFSRTSRNGYREGSSAAAEVALAGCVGDG